MNTDSVRYLSDEDLERLSAQAYRNCEELDREIGRRINNRTWTLGELGRRIRKENGELQVHHHLP